MKKNICSLFVACFFTTGVLAQSSNFAPDTPSLNRKVRNLGMGNVGVALKGTHDSSPFYNPAGLNDLKKGKFEFLSFTAEISKNAFGLVGDVRDFVSDVGDAGSDADKFRVLDSFISANTGEFRKVRLTVDLFNYARKNFAIGVLLDEKLDLAFREPGIMEFEVRNRADIAGYVSGAHDFWDQLLQVGVTFKPTVRLSLDETDEVINFTDIQDDANGNPRIEDQLKQIYKEQRFGLGVDLGLKSNLGFKGIKDEDWYKMLQPSVGFTWQDIGGVEFDSGSDNVQTMSAGVAVHPKIWKLENAFAVDIRDINHERPFLSKLHIGMESKLPWIVALRAGLSQGYLTGGASLDLWFAKLDGAVYFEEIGNKTREEGNLRWAVRLSFNI